jgi:hypothetical protein
MPAMIRGTKGRESVRRCVYAASLAILTAVLASAPVTGHPPGEEAYHTYPEMVAEIQQVAADHPDIVRLSTIGKTYKGRDIHIVRITDRPDEEEGEPEVLLDSLHHAREHLTPEMTLSIIHLLTDGHGIDPRITAIVDSRVIWVIPMLNPDGLAYDLGRDPYRRWRKNRQPNGPGEPKGTDLNRNYGYRWGGPGSSGDPGSEVYRGASPWSAPETRAMRDFVLSRVVDGRQRIRALITFHTNGEQIFYPYAHTTVHVPPDMTRRDRRVFVALAEQMAATNGYSPQQSSDPGLKSGGFVDWSYGTQRIFGFTFELYPSNDDETVDHFYPPAAVIERETERNHEAVLHLLEQADCPYRSIGKEAGFCGPYYDDMEIARGWSTDPEGRDTATSGAWQRGVPQATYSPGPKQLAMAPSGQAVLSTGRKSMGCASCNDVDGGTTTVRSPAIDLPPSGTATLRLRYSLAHDATASPDDGFRVAIISAGSRSVIFEDLAAASDRDGRWQALAIDLTPWAGRQVRVQFEAFDMAGPSLLEAAVDDVRVTAH